MTPGVSSRTGGGITGEVVSIVENTHVHANVAPCAQRPPCTSGGTVTVTWTTLLLRILPDSHVCMLRHGAGIYIAPSPWRESSLAINASIISANAASHWDSTNTGEDGEREGVTN